MLKTFICGSGNFVDEENDDPTWISSSSSSPSRKKPTKTNIFNTKNNKNNNNKNPYSNRGRDKFETVLAELEQRRQKIYQKYMDSQDQIEMIRFVYSNSKGTWIPIVVKLRDQKQKDKAAGAGDHKEKQNSDSSEAENMNKSSSPITEVSEEPIPDSDGMNMKKNRLVGVKNLVRWLKRYVHNYWAIMVIILIMVCLVIYGRSFAIICTSIFWYLMPLLKGNKEESLSLMKRSLKKKKILKKDFVRSESEHKMNTTTTTTSNGISSPKTKMNVGSAGLLSSPRFSLV